TIAIVFPGQSGAFPGTLNSVSGYSSTVALSCQPGVTAIPDGGCAPTPASLTPTASFTLTASGSQAQDYIFNLQGAGSDALNTTHSQSLTLRVVDYSLSQPSQIN